MKRKEYQKLKKKNSKKSLAIKISLLLTISLFLMVATYAITLQKKASNAADRAYEAVADRTKSEKREIEVKPATDNVSVLFIGVDDSDMRAQGDSNSRSDALLLATLNPKQKTVNLVSIPRDSYVYIPEIKRRDKINHAHAFGGTRATIETVEELLEIPVDYYVKMNFNAFIDVVDAFGGIEVEVPYERIEKDENDQNTIHLKPGLQHLDGRHALALARTRKLDSDIERGKRQQMILQAIMKEATSMTSITKYGDVIDAIGDNMKTNMTFKEMLSFIEYVKGGMPKVNSLTLTGEDDMSTGIYYYKVDETELEELKQLLQAHLGLIPDSSSMTKNDSGLLVNVQEQAVISDN